MDNNKSKCVGQNIRIHTYLRWMKDNILQPKITMNHIYDSRYTTINVMQPTRHNVTYAVVLHHVVDSSGSTNHRVSPFQAENWPLPHKPLYSFHSKPSPNHAKCRKTYPQFSVINIKRFLHTNSASKRLSSNCLPVSDNSH